MIKIIYFILSLFLFTISFINQGSAEICKNIQDAYKDFDSDIKKLNKKVNKTKNPNDPNLQAIDEAFVQINQILSVANPSCDKKNLDLLESNLNFLSAMIDKTSKLIPNEYEKDLSKIDISQIKEVDPQIITEISSSMKLRRTDNQQTLLEDMIVLKENGVDVFKINSDLNKKGISIISNEEISEVISKNADDKKLKSDIIKELKLSGATSDEILQLEKGIQLASIQPEKNLKSEDNPIKIERVKPSEKRIDSITTLKTLSLLKINNADDRQSTGVPYEEFSKIENELSSQIKAAGFNQEQSKQVMFNLRTKYVDVWFHAREVYEKVLTNGGTIEQAVSAERNWLNQGGGNFGLKKWIDLFNKNTSTTIEQRYSLKDYLNELNPNQIKVELASADRIAKEAQARVLSYFTVEDPTGERRSAGKIVDEAKAISNKVKESAIKYGINTSKAEILASNAAMSYLNTWYAGTLVSEAQLAKGYTWEGVNGADQAVMNWYNSLAEDSEIKKWDARLYNPSDDNDFNDDELDYLPNDEALQKWFSKLNDSDFTKLNPSDQRINSEALARTLSYLKFNDQGNIAGDLGKEVGEIQKSIIDYATSQGIKGKEIEIISTNAVKRYLDIWFEGTLISETELAKGNTWKEADAAVDKWANSLTGDMVVWANLLYGDNERFKADDQFFTKLSNYLLVDLELGKTKSLADPKKDNPNSVSKNTWNPKDAIGTGNFKGLSAAEALGSNLSAAVKEIQASLNSGAVIRGADGSAISVEAALSSMPAGGKINPDGTLEPVPSTTVNP